MKRFILIQSARDPESFSVCLPHPTRGFVCMQYESGSLRHLIDDLIDILPVESGGQSARPRASDALERPVNQEPSPGLSEQHSIYESADDNNEIRICEWASMGECTDTGCYIAKPHRCNQKTDRCFRNSRKTVECVKFPLPAEDAPVSTGGIGDRPTAPCEAAGSEGTSTTTGEQQRSPRCVGKQGNSEPERGTH